MKRSLLLLLGLSACTPAAPLPPEYGSQLPALDANGLPPAFTACVRNRAQTETQLYDVFYECRKKNVWHVIETPDMSQEDKTILLDRLDTRGIDFAHKVVVARHGDRALPPIASAAARHAAPAPTPAPAPPTAPPLPLDDFVVVDQQKQPRGELRF